MSVAYIYRPIAAAMLGGLLSGQRSGVVPSAPTHFAHICAGTNRASVVDADGLVKLCRCSTRSAVRLQTPRAPIVGTRLRAQSEGARRRVGVPGRALGWGAAAAPADGEDDDDDDEVVAAGGGVAHGADAWDVRVPVPAHAPRGVAQRRRRVPHSLCGACGGRTVATCELPQVYSWGSSRNYTLGHSDGGNKLRPTRLPHLLCQHDDAEHIAIGGADAAHTMSGRDGRTLAVCGTRDSDADHCLFSTQYELVCVMNPMLGR